MMLAHSFLKAKLNREQSIGSYRLWVSSLDPSGQPS